MKILSMKTVRGKPRADTGATVVGVFLAQVGDLLLEGCQILRRDDGRVVVALPTFSKYSRHIKRSARFADIERYRAFYLLAMEAFEAAGGMGKGEEPEDAGMRRVIGAAEDESLREAGL